MGLRVYEWIKKEEGGIQVEESDVGKVPIR